MPVGAFCWEQTVAGTPKSQPGVVNDTVYWGNDIGYLYSMVAETGTQAAPIWHNQQPPATNLANYPSSPIYIPYPKDIMLIGGADWVIYALKVKGSAAPTVQWRFPASGNSSLGRIL